MSTSGRISSDRGSVLVEAVIAIPIFLGLIFLGIWEALILSEQFIVREALFSSARDAVVASSYQSSACRTNALALFGANMQRLSPMVPLSNFSFSATPVTLSSGGFAVRFSVEGGAQCPGCMILGFHSIPLVKASTVMPLSDGASCQDLDAN